MKEYNNIKNNQLTQSNVSKTGRRKSISSKDAESMKLDSYD